MLNGGCLDANGSCTLTWVSINKLGVLSIVQPFKVGDSISRSIRGKVYSDLNTTTKPTSLGNCCYLLSLCFGLGSVSALGSVYLSDAVPLLPFLSLYVLEMSEA